MRPLLLLAAPLVALALATPSPAADPEGALDIGQVLAAVLGANRDLAVARAAQRAAWAEAREAAAPRLPRLDLSAGYLHTDQVMQIPAVPGGEMDPSFFTGWRDQWSVHLGARQVLWSGGEVSGSADAAEEGAQASQLETAERELLAAYQGKELFLRLLLAQEQVAIAREQLANARDHASQAEQRYGAGDASRFELLQARVRAANLEAPLAAAERARGEAAAQLSRLMGRDPDPQLAVRGTLEVDDDSLPAGAGTLTTARRPAVEAAAARWRQAVSLSQVAGATRFPRLSLVAAYDTRSDRGSDLFSPRHDDWSAGVSLDYTLFDGGASQARRARAAAMLESATEALARAQAGARLDADLALLSLAEARASRASAAQTVAQALEAVAIAKVGYGAGTASHLDVVDAEVGLAAARTRQAEADYRFLSARAQWDYAAGLLPPEVSP